MLIFTVVIFTYLVPTNASDTSVTCDIPEDPLFPFCSKKIQVSLYLKIAGQFSLREPPLLQQVDVEFFKNLKWLNSKREREII